MLGSTEAIIALQKPADTLSPIVQPTLLDRVLLYEEDEGCMAMGPWRHGYELFRIVLTVRIQDFSFSLMGNLFQTRQEASHEMSVTS